MGMYTEIVVSAQIKDIPEVVAVLDFMAGHVDKVPILPGHPLFMTSRWQIMFRCCSHYFVPLSVVRFEFNDISRTWSLIVRADLKNYDGEIGLFFEWIKPYVDYPDTMIGYSRYEEDREPTIYYS